MLIILKDDYKGVGKAGEVVKVKDGHARNYLIPQGFAYPATDAYLNVYKEENKSKLLKLKKVIKDAESVKEVIDGKAITIKMKSGEEDKLFGSVTSQNIADEIAKAYNAEIDKKKIVINEAIKTLGEHKVNYKIHPEVEITVTVNVEKEEE